MEVLHFPHCSDEKIKIAFWKIVSAMMSLYDTGISTDIIHTCKIISVPHSNRIILNE